VRSVAGLEIYQEVFLLFAFLEKDFLESSLGVNVREKILMVRGNGAATPAAASILPLCDFPLNVLSDGLDKGLEWWKNQRLAPSSRSKLLYFGLI